MGISHRTSGSGLALRVWDRRASRELGLFIVALVVTRTFRKGLDIHDRKFKPYSRRRIYIGKNSEIARRRAPRGGVDTGASIRFDQGYWEYQDGQDVKLTLSGELMRSIKVKRATGSEVVVGLTGAAIIHGRFVQQAGRPFMGLSPRDKAAVRRKARKLVREAMDRSRRRAA